MRDPESLTNLFEYPIPEINWLRVSILESDPLSLNPPSVKPVLGL